jgi:hypothetical protein
MERVNIKWNDDGSAIYTYYHTDGSAGYKPVVIEFNHAVFANTRGTKVPYIAVTCDGEKVLSLVRRVIKEQMPDVIVEMNREFGKNAVLLYSAERDSLEMFYSAIAYGFFAGKIHGK